MNEIALDVYKRQLHNGVSPLFEKADEFKNRWREHVPAWKRTLYQGVLTFMLDRVIIVT